MHYLSTRGTGERYDDLDVLLEGLAPDGGLFVPESIPRMDRAFFERLTELDYADRAAEVLALFLPSFTLRELQGLCRRCYSEARFPGGPAPLTRLNPFDPKFQMLELWHGPSGAFKDLALQLLPELQRAAMKKAGQKEGRLILTATSGDTGKAALEAFKDQEGFRIVVLYPKRGVAPLQELQMQTTTGENVEVIPIDGDFDDCQRLVKSCFQDEALVARVREQGYRLSTANSINWGRLLAQIAYYVSAFVSLLGGEGNQQAEAWYDRGERHGTPRHDEEIQAAKEQAKDRHAIPFDVCVPSGNFGNILAAWYAKEMGVPIRKLICASNRNRVLADFFRTGTYAPQEKLYQTSSPSMDILVSSNLERLLFEMCDHDATKVRQWMEELQEKGRYKVDKETYRRIRRDFRGSFASESGVQERIRGVYHRYDHLIDPHTAVAFEVIHRLEQSRLKRSKSEEENREDNRSGNRGRRGQRRRGGKQKRENARSRAKQRTPELSQEELRELTPQRATIVVSTASPYKFPETVAEALYSRQEVRGKSPFELLRMLEEESDLPIPQSFADLETLPRRFETVSERDEVPARILRFVGAEPLAMAESASAEGTMNADSDARTEASGTETRVSSEEGVKDSDASSEEASMEVEDAAPTTMEETASTALEDEVGTSDEAPDQDGSEDGEEPDADVDAVAQSAED